VTVIVDQTTEAVVLKWTQGDNMDQSFELADLDDQPYDLTGIQIASYARSTLGALAPLNVNVEPAAGLIHVSGPGLAPDLYDFDIQFAYPNGGVATWIHGRIQVREGVTP
jgi:hypothetical protein